MAITKQDKQALDQLYSDERGKYGGTKEDYFALLYLTRKFKCDVADIASQVCFGGCDYGVDAYHVDREARNLYLFQFKWSENHNLFRDSLERLANSGMDCIFGNPTPDPNQNEVLNALRSDLYESKAIIDRVLIRFVFKGDIEDAYNSEGLQYRREVLENKVHLLHTFFGRQDIELTVEFDSDVRHPPRINPPESYRIAFEDTTCLQFSENGPEMHVGFIPLMDLVRIHRSLGPRFLDRNIRSGLSPDNPPNRKIREALADIVIKQQTAPEVFAFNHNGITLAAERLEKADGIVTVHVPRLLNGAQTITSVARFLEENEGHPAINGDPDELCGVKVLAKVVIEDPSSEFVTNVTICNNRQNPVAPWNLRANDKIQCDLHDRFREELGVFYSRQENAFRNRSKEELERLGYDLSIQRDIRIKQLAQTFLAAQGEIRRMSRLHDVFESSKWYGDTFRESYLKCDPRRIVLAYKVGLVIRTPLERISERASQKHAGAIKKARNLVWALSIQGLFNHSKLPTLLENWGTSLKNELGFRDHLRELSSSRLLNILRELLNKQEYADRIANEQYEFLRTKEIFTQCMDVAYDKFGWKKKSFNT